MISVGRVSLLVLCCFWAPSAQLSEPERIRLEGMAHPGSFSILSDLTKKVGGRLSGSPQAALAVSWGKKQMERLGLSSVHLIPCKVAHWVRGPKELASISYGNRREELSVCALGGSVATPKTGITAEVVEVKSLDEASKLGSRARGKIIFFNRAFDPTLLNTFSAYGGAVDQRSRGASVAAKVGAIGAIVRSMSTADDDAPHTGAMSYESGVARIPAAAISVKGANRLSALLKSNPRARFSLLQSCRTLPEVDSASVVGEITGSGTTPEIVLVGGHLDSWDLGEGAHDDGAGIAQSIEVLRIFKRLGLHPKRTIRVVLFMNEENGGAGGKSYADVTSRERHYAAIESDAGGFAPRAFGATATPQQIEMVREWLPFLNSVGIERINIGGGGSDISPLGSHGAMLFGLQPESQRYFDYHHSRNDTLDKVNPRELELGAIAMAILAWQLSEN